LWWLWVISTTENQPCWIIFAAATTPPKKLGGITQHLSAYVVKHKTKDGSDESITFLDTPGHEAFQKMRLRGADVADVAILVVSAEDGVKPQTLEALESIKQANIPYIVAINKIDKPSADIPRVQASLIENEIYIEGMGGDIPWIGISAKTGEGISDLLDLIILATDLIELNGDIRRSSNWASTGRKSRFQAWQHCYPPYKEWHLKKWYVCGSRKLLCSRAHHGGLFG
jgi:small GTP-binding protein